jgi:dihydropteroate synthase
MGILNMTPDSFFDKGAYFSPEKAIARALEMQAQGADILDVGAVSSRPGAPVVSEEEELARVIPVLQALRGKLSIPISIDTCTPRVAREAVLLGAQLVNDITGMQNPEMQEVAAYCEADVCVMHMQGTPQTMQEAPSYPEGVVEHLMRFFDRQINALVQKGVSENRIILDPGIGFGKTLEHNLAIFQAIPQFKRFGLRVLIAASRKSFMTKIVGKPPAELLPSTLFFHTMALRGGADIIRAHDIPEHRDLIDAFSILTRFENSSELQPD